jgi:hypothetical protein
MSAGWGFEHGAPVYWHCIDDFGIIRTCREFLRNHEPPETLAESIAKEQVRRGWHPAEVPLVLLLA